MPPVVTVNPVAAVIVPGALNVVGILSVTAPVDADAVISFAVPDIDVTPVFDNVTVPPNATGLPETPRPVPPVIVIVLLVNALFGIPLKLVPVSVGVVVNTGFAEADPCSTPAAPAKDVGTPVDPYI